VSEFEQRFGGTQRIYGEQGVANFKQAHVCILGIGGVGSWVAEALARSGIGEFTLVDADDICITNTNRQVHVLNDTIGDVKTEAMCLLFFVAHRVQHSHCSSIFIECS